MDSTMTRAKEVPLESATRARIRFEHGAGELVVRPGADPGVLLVGDVGERAEMDVRRDGERVDVVVRAIGGGWRDLIDPAAWTGPRRPFDWDVRLNSGVPLELEFATGASRSRLDLSGVRATAIVVNTGMSATELTVPAAAGMTTVDVHAGLADITIRVPTGVAASIHGKLGLASLDVDRERFRPIADGYESPDYATAPNRALIRVEGGLESVRVI